MVMHSLPPPLVQSTLSSSFALNNVTQINSPHFLSFFLIYRNIRITAPVALHILGFHLVQIQFSVDTIRQSFLYLSVRLYVRGMIGCGSYPVSYNPQLEMLYVASLLVAVTSCLMKK